jgi:MFS superfamily sulfate permease-like transporter
MIQVFIYPLLGFGDLWEAWKNSKKDFFLIVATITLQFLFNTEVAVTSGLALSFAYYVYESNFSSNVQSHLDPSVKASEGINLVKVHSISLSFISAPYLKDFIASLTFKENEPPHQDSSLSHKIFHAVTSTMDAALAPKIIVPVKVLPRLLVVDLQEVKTIDLTAMMILNEALNVTVRREVSFIFINVHSTLKPVLTKYGLKNVIFTKHGQDKDVLMYEELSSLETISDPGKTTVIEDASSKFTEEHCNIELRKMQDLEEQKK